MPRRQDAPNLPDVDSPAAEDIVEDAPSTEDLVEEAQPLDELLGKQASVAELIGRDRDEPPEHRSE